MKTNPDYLHRRPGAGDIDELLAAEDGAAGQLVSIYNSPSGGSRRGDVFAARRVRFRTQLQAARRLLRSRGATPRQIRRQLAAATKLARSRSVWRRPRTLALFSAPRFAGREAVYWLAATGDDLAAVGARFRLLTVLAAASGGLDSGFNVLAVSHSGARYLAGDADRLTQIDQDRAPRGVRGDHVEDTGRPLQMHSGTPASDSPGGERPAMFHGHGEGDGHGHNGREPAALRRWLRRVTDHAATVLDTDCPTVLVCVEPLAPMVHDANRRLHFAPALVAGSPDQLAVSELHRRALAATQPAAPRAGEAGANARPQLTEMAEIKTAAREGRVAELVVRSGSGSTGVEPGSNGDGHGEGKDADAAARDELEQVARMIYHTGGVIRLARDDAHLAGSEAWASLRY